MAGLFFSSFYVIARELSGSRGPTPAPEPLFGAAGRAARASRRAGGAASPPSPVPAGALARASNAGAEPVATGPSEAPKTDLFRKLKAAVAEFGAPAVKLDDDPTPEPPPGKPGRGRKSEPRESREEPAREKPEPRPGDIWVRDPFAPQPQAAPEAQLTSGLWEERREDRAPRGAPGASGALVSDDLIDRIAQAGGGEGVVALLADAGIGAAPLYALATARALSRRGRTILVQAGPDRRLDAALQCDADQPGLANLLAGEASYAEAIFRDGESRLHLLGRGGALDADAEDLASVIAVLRATYDFVLLAAGADALGLDFSREADVVAILGADSGRRDYMHDDFAAAGAKNLILASPDAEGQLSAGAA
jgi:hypothetical protein